MMLSDVGLSVAHIGPKSRTERAIPRHTWLGHHFQGQKSKVKVTCEARAYCGGLPATACYAHAF